MLQLTPKTIIYISTSHVDFRRGIDGLAGFCRNSMMLDSSDGSMFVFYNRKLTSIKILVYDGQGYILFIKRLSSGKFKSSPSSFKNKHSSSDNFLYQKICHRILQIVINNGDPSTAKFAKDWRKI